MGRLGGDESKKTGWEDSRRRGRGRKSQLKFGEGLRKRGGAKMECRLTCHEINYQRLLVGTVLESRVAGVHESDLEASKRRRRQLRVPPEGGEVDRRM